MFLLFNLLEQLQLLVPHQACLADFLSQCFRLFDLLQSPAVDRLQVVYPTLDDVCIPIDLQLADIDLPYQPLLCQMINSRHMCETAIIRLELHRLIVLAHAPVTIML